MTTTITHVTPHIGVGIGKAITSLIIGSHRKHPDFHHEILLLEPPKNTFFNEKCARYNIPVHISSDKQERNDIIKDADIVQVEWWHHPLTYQFLYDLPQIPMRMLMWYHVNGCHHPYMKPEFADIPTAYVLTGAYTYDNVHWSQEQRDHLKAVSPVVNSCGGFAGFDTPLVKHSGFTVGFLGTLDYAKINSEFMNYLYSVAHLDGIRFRIVGEGPELENMKAWLENKEFAYKFTFTGFVQDVSKELAQFDVCAQILSTEPYDTAQLSLLENMSMGVPPIVLNQASEKYIIVNDDIGFKVKGIDGFRHAVETLYFDRIKQQKMSEAARKYVRETFTCERLVSGMHAAYDKALSTEKKLTDFKPIIGNTPGDWFMSSVAPGQDITKKARMRGENKLSVRQWLRYYPGDVTLKRIEEQTR